MLYHNLEYFKFFKQMQLLICDNLITFHIFFFSFLYALLFFLARIGGGAGGSLDFIGIQLRYNAKLICVPPWLLCAKIKPFVMSNRINLSGRLGKKGLNFFNPNRVQLGTISQRAKQKNYQWGSLLRYPHPKGQLDKTDEGTG
jgi:hypothetical protein